MDSGGAGEPVDRLASLHKILANCTHWCDDGKDAKALKAMSDAEKQYKDDPEALLLLGKCYTDMEEDEKATNCLERSINLEPNKDWDKYVSLAQLQKGPESVQSFERALKVLMTEHPEAIKAVSKKADVDLYINGEMPITELEDKAITQDDVRDIHLSMLDNYISDEYWDRPESKTKSKQTIDYLLTLMPDDIETLQAAASYYLRIEDKEQAKKYLQQSLQLWEPKYAKLRDHCKGQDTSDAVDFMDAAATFDIIPSPEFRASTMELLGDLGETEKALELGNNMLDVEKVREYGLYAKMAVLYKKLKNTDKEKEMLEKLFLAGVYDELFDIEDNPALSDEQRKERADIIAKYIEAGGTEEELKEKVEAEMEKADEMGSDEEDDEDEDDDDDEDDDEDEEDDDDMEE